MWAVPDAIEGKSQAWFDEGEQARACGSAITALTGEAILAPSSM